MSPEDATLVNTALLAVIAIAGAFTAYWSHRGQSLGTANAAKLDAVTKDVAVVHDVVNSANTALVTSLAVEKDKNTALQVAAAQHAPPL
jgi:hypothetical protein